MLECKEMDESRRAYKLEDKKSLLKWMEQRKNQDTNVTMREFLGNTRQPRSFYINGGLCLTIHRQDFSQLGQQNVEKQ